MRRRLLRILLALIAVIATPLGILTFTAYDPPPEAPADVRCAGDQVTLRKGDAFTLVSWNIQFSASRKHQFFYDGGDVVQVPRADVDETLAAIAKALRALGPDLALLQEVDRGSDRTHRVDQLGPLLDALKDPCEVSAPYHRARFVPFPVPDFLGKVDMNLAVLSRFSMRQAARVQLPLLKESRIRQAFNLKRALLHAEVPVEGLSHPLAIAVTHLSAFSRGDGTLAEQVAVLEAWMSARPEGQPWILAGDLNLLPPGDDPKRLRVHSELFADEVNPIERLLPRFQEIFGARNQLDTENRTYLPFGYQEPDRKIDYVFYGGPIEVEEAEVLRRYSALSDHLPVRAVLRLGEAAGRPGDVRGGGGGSNGQNLPPPGVPPHERVPYHPSDPDSAPSNIDTGTG
ncbi:MAG: endonuclease/exonuclease/phosphatase family protein [Alphaproteobacteria bacterium]|nr:endonuclease/exonuclease/phosphatase family protein [Alphaproteobacteria bacterium]